MSKSKKDTKKEEKINAVGGDLPEGGTENCDAGVSSDELNDLKAQFEALREKFVEAEKKRDDYLLTAQRIQAEFENFKKRTASVRAEAYDDGMRQLASDILPVVDNFERALKSSSALAASSEELSAFHEGVEMISKQLLEVLSRHGLVMVDPIGEVFDAELHNAAMQTPAEEGQEPGTIADVFQKGYRMKDKMIRYATVRVVGEK